ncbi:MAG: helix-turn-helix domain-containing protein [Gaiellaceae bacterium]
MGRIGNTLREARLRLGLSLTDAQKATKIRARYLEALEQERFDVLPAPAYARGFLRSYADLLGVDPEPLLLELAPALAELEPPPPPPPPARRLPLARRTLVVLGTLVALGAGLALLGLDLDRRTPTPLPPKPLPAAAASSQRPTAPAEAPTRRARPAGLVLAAIGGDCWLSVRQGSAAGALVWQGLLRRGASLRLGRPPLWFRMGAPWNITARLGSRALAGLPSAPRPANVLVTAAGAAPG